MRKRISSVLAGLLAALLLWGLAPVTAEAAGASFSGSGSVRAGDSVTVTFTVSGSNIQGITAVLHYDSSALTLTGATGRSWKRTSACRFPTCGSGSWSDHIRKNAPSASGIFAAC